MDESTCANRKIKDAIFTEIFKDKDNIKELYKTLFPNQNIKNFEITNETIDTLITNSIRNDLSFRTSNDVVVFIEAQSSWKTKDIVRFSEYFNKKFYELFHTLDYEDFRNLRFYFYVFYTGKSNLKKYYSLNKDIFKNPTSMHDFKLEVISENNGIPEGILRDYKRVCDIQVDIYKKYGRTSKAVEKFFYACIEENLFPRIFNVDNKEFIDTMQNFDIYYNQFQDFLKEEREKGIEVGRKEGIETGRKEGIEEEKITIAISMIESSLDNETIQKFTKLSIEKIESLRKEV